MSTTATRAPSSASARTIPRPIPRSCAAPVTSATFPSRRTLGGNLPLRPRPLEAVAPAADQLLVRVGPPQRVGVVDLDRTVVGEELHVAPAVPAAGLQRPEEGGEIHRPLTGKRAV